MSYPSRFEAQGHRPYAEEIMLPLEDFTSSGEAVMSRQRRRSTTTTTTNINNNNVGSTLTTSMRVAATTSSSNYPAENHAPLYTSQSDALTAASADFHRNLLQQQVQQSVREGGRLREEVQDLQERLRTATNTAKDNKVEVHSLQHRLGASEEKLSSAENQLQMMEEQLRAEKARTRQLREDAERTKADLRQATATAQQMQHAVEDLQANRGLDPREVQRMLDDRSQFVPAAEVQRMQSELRSSRQQLMDRLSSAMEALLNTNEGADTARFVARSAVLSASTDLDARLSKAEMMLANAHKGLTQFMNGVEEETQDFLLSLIAENKELWQQLTQLQSEHKLVVAELHLRQTKGEVVPIAQHEYVQRQLESLTERLGKAQQLVVAQTALAGEHEMAMQQVLSENEELRRQVEQLSERHTTMAEDAQQRTTALEEADAALSRAKSEMVRLQEELVVERRTCETTIQQLQTTSSSIQQDLEVRLRNVQRERDQAVEQVSSTTSALEEATHCSSELRIELQTQVEAFAQYRERSEVAMEQRQQSQLGEVERVRILMEEEMANLHAKLETATLELRDAQSARTAACEEVDGLNTSLRRAEESLALVRSENSGLQRQVRELNEAQRALTDALENLRGATGEATDTVDVLQTKLRRSEEQRMEVSRRLEAEVASEQARYQKTLADWKLAEAARGTLQEEIKTLRTRYAESEAQRQSLDHHGQDREHLMAENLRLHEQYELIQKENVVLVENIKTMKVRHQSAEKLAEQMDELQRRMRELPQLRQAAEEAKLEAARAKEETEALRRERDVMAAKLERFLEGSKASSRLDEDFDRVLRDANAAVHRLGGQLTNAQSRRPAPTPGGTAAAASAMDAGGCGGRRGSAVGTGATTPSMGGSSKRLFTSPQRTSGKTSPRPWKG